VILDELTLYNFGVYRGKQTLTLTPSAEQPVVLIGALNGAGKTTILDALRLVLYGRHASSTDRSRGSYHDYLRRSIHRDGHNGHAAGIELQFRYRLEGNEESFRIFRSWRDTGSVVKEDVQVFRNSGLDSAATERWGEFVEQFIPNQISELFFFDGEKIESLADPERSAELLRVGVHALLGLDLVDDLVHSLLQVERRRRAKLATVTDNDTLAIIDTELSHVERRREELLGKMASLQIAVDSAEKELSDREFRLKAEGGDLFSRRDELRARLDMASRAVAGVEAEIREQVAEVLPLLIVRNLIGELRRTITAEAESTKQRLLCSLLEQRDTEILAALDRANINDRAVKTINAALQADRAQRANSIQGSPYYNIDPQHLGQYTEDSLSEQARRLEDSLRRYSSAVEEVAALERAVVAIPDEAKVHDLLQGRDAARDRVVSLRAKLQTLAEERGAVEQERVSSERKRDQFLRGLSEQQASDIITHRVISHSERCRHTLARFRQAMRDRHVARLEQSVTQCFQQLLRKRTLVERIEIDPDCFELRIRGATGSLVPAERLSAGERQLLAVAVLWGLAKASGRQLPTIIDTPLGRLDSEHRRYLVEQYFPVASHQVILLSTDEEIEGAYYEGLKPSVCREYIVSYSDVEHYSSILSGYFPQTRAAA
jgi:DNA sulfur modification protein DndD